GYRCACCVGVGAEVSGGVGRAYPVAVAGGGVDGGVLVAGAGAGGGGDLGEVAAARARAALDAVAADADVIGGGAPGEIDLAARHSSRAKRSRLRRRGGIQRGRR